MPLTDILCKTAKPKEKPYKLADSAGMFLLVSPSGSKYWRLKYRFAGKEKLLALGVYPEVSLKEARDKRDIARKQISAGIDPSQNKKEEKLQIIIKTENSFESVAREWHIKQKASWTEKQGIKVLRRLEMDIFPAIGSKTIEEITAPELLSALRAAEERGATYTAHQNLQTCGRIFRYAIATGKARYDISASLRGALKTHKPKNHKSLPENDLPEFLQNLEKYDGDLQTKLALKLTILTFLRTGEVRGARWEEINFDKKEWRIPAHRMKMRDEHIIPLSTQAIAILTEMQKISGNWENVFPGRVNPTSCMSENTMLYATYRMGYHGRTTVHGFRSTASTILNENGFKPDVIERQLSHLERNKVRGAYNHAEYLPERRAMMQWWADYLDRAAQGGGNVVEGKFIIA